MDRLLGLQQLLFILEWLAASICVSVCVCVYEWWKEKKTNLERDGEYKPLSLVAMKNLNVLPSRCGWTV